MILIESVIIEQEDNDYLQFLYFEVESYKSILEHILICKNPKYQYSVENYRHFMNEYKEANIKYNLTVTEILNKYNYQQYIGKIEYRYTFDFYFNTIEIHKLEPHELQNPINRGCDSCGR